MTIEATLDRIANALEVLAHATFRNPALMAEPIQQPLVEKTEKSYVEQRKEEIKQEAKAETPVVEKKARGRPPGPAKAKVETPPVETLVVETPVVVEDEEDPFAETPEPVVEEKQPTAEEIRNTMIALRTKIGKEKAYSFLREHGNGATRLAGSTASTDGNTAGELKPEYFAAVMREAKKLLG